MLRHAILASLALAAAAPAATGQTRVFGYDIRNARTFRSTLPGFVNNFTGLATDIRPLYGVDMDASGSTIYAIDDNMRSIHTISKTTGVVTTSGTPLLGVPNTPATRVSGLAAHPGTGGWALSLLVSTSATNIYVGNVETGSFSVAGTLQGLSLIDIAYDAQGRLFGLNLNDGGLYRITVTPTTSATLIGIVDNTIAFAQGMDFDWSTNQLYAALYSGSGLGRLVEIDTMTGAPLTVASTVPLDAELEICIERGGFAPFGTTYCQGNTNSTGVSGDIEIRGSALTVDDRATLRASRLPNASFGFFITSRLQGFVANPNGSQGDLCLSGPIGRYVGAGQIQNTFNTGAFELDIQFSGMPQPNGFESGVMGETWNFQAWHRDVVAGAVTSNFTSGLSIQLQ